MFIIGFIKKALFKGWRELELIKWGDFIKTAIFRTK